MRLPPAKPEAAGSTTARTACTATAASMAVPPDFSTSQPAFAAAGWAAAIMKSLPLTGRMRPGSELSSQMFHCTSAGAVAANGSDSSSAIMKIRTIPPMFFRQNDFDAVIMASSFFMLMNAASPFGSFVLKQRLRDLKMVHRQHKLKNAHGGEDEGDSQPNFSGECELVFGSQIISQRKPDEDDRQSDEKHADVEVYGHNRRLYKIR
jgi:hypothetical protein